MRLVPLLVVIQLLTIRVSKVTYFCNVLAASLSKVTLLNNFIHELPMKIMQIFFKWNIHTLQPMKFEL